MNALPSAADCDLRRRLAELAAALWPEVRTIAGLHRLAGGVHRENWAFDAVCDAGTTPLVLRRGAAAPAVAAPAVEAGLLRLVRQAGVPAPAVRLVLRPQNGLGEGCVMERVPGAAPGCGDAARPSPPAASLARRCGQVLARIHHVPLGALPPLRSGPAAVEVARCLAPHRGTPRPVLDAAHGWLERHAPGAPIKPALVHGDFRPAKLLVDATGLRAVLDWKRAHLGDPMEDLGGICVEADGAAERPAGDAFRAALYAGYEDAGGRVDAERVHYWEVFGTLKRALPAGADDAETARLRVLLGL